MKWWHFVILTILCWGAYVPMIHHGQTAMGKNSGLRCFLFVGLAYFVGSVIAMILLKVRPLEPWAFSSGGMRLSFIAGVLGSIGALGVIFAMKPTYGGTPLIVAPLVFAGAPIMNTFVSIAWSPPKTKPVLWFYVGIALAAAGAAMALYHKPK